MYDVIIIGAGPAGLTAAIYVLRAGKKTLVLEGKAIGGQIVNAQKIENYPGIVTISGGELTKNMKEQVKSLGGAIKLEKVIGIDFSGEIKRVETDMGESYEAKSVIIATGAESRKMGLEHEDELVGRGVSYCATCDGNFYQGKDVAVVGGGNTALMDAIYLADLANKVYLVHRRDEFRAEKAYVDEVKQKDNVELVLNSNVISLNADKTLKSIIVRDKQTEEEREIHVEGVFAAIGYQPMNEVFKEAVELDKSGYIQTEDGVHTSAEKVYVAGDARAKELKQLVTAMSDGAIAATVAVQEI